MQDTFTGYIPKIGDRVQISAIDYTGNPGAFAGQVGTVRAVAPALTSCHVWLDDLTDEDNSWLGYPGTRFFPGEVSPLD